MRPVRLHPFVIAVFVILFCFFIYQKVGGSNGLIVETVSSDKNAVTPQLTPPPVTKKDENIDVRYHQVVSSSHTIRPVRYSFPDNDPDACKTSEIWGRPHHGGWYVCKDNLEPAKCIIYSYGLGADWSFDNAAEKFGCEVHGFDPSNLLWNQGMHGADFSRFHYDRDYPSKLKHFHNWGVGAASKAIYPPGTVPQDWPGLGDPPLSQSNSQPWDMRSIEQTMKDLNHTNSDLTILKIDVEGAEWDALIAFFASPIIEQKVKAGRIPQLLIEYHWDPDSKLRDGRHHNLIKRIQKIGYVPWRIERHEGSDCCADVSYIWKKS